MKHIYRSSLALLLILAFAVVFFAACGKKDVPPVKPSEICDLKLRSRVGFSDEDIAYLRRSIDSINDIGGAYSEDFIFKNDAGSEYVVRARSVGAFGDDLKLVTGRMPTEANECVADAATFASSVLNLPLAVTDKGEGLSGDSYTIVGLVQSPAYAGVGVVDSEIGDGQVDGYVYMLAEAFSLRYYTELYIRLEYACAYNSPAYRALVEDVEKSLAARCDADVSDRLASLRRELAAMQEEYNFAEAEYKTDMENTSIVFREEQQRLNEQHSELVAQQKEQTALLGRIEEEIVTMNEQCETVQALLDDVANYERHEEINLQLTRLSEEILILMSHRNSAMLLDVRLRQEIDRVEGEIEYMNAAQARAFENLHRRSDELTAMKKQITRHAGEITTIENGNGYEIVRVAVNLPK